ncbi:MAG: preprotein translocase [Candidatus Leucobacter sulfamidivorax]|nr:preprotein translocase [Candidatus Leucobacter sulfamidivorax]
MVGNLSGMHLLAILAIVLLLFGAPRLPGLARSLGQSMRILKQEAGDDPPKQPSEPTGGSPEV